MFSDAAGCTAPRRCLALFWCRLALFWRPLAPWDRSPFGSFTTRWRGGAGFIARAGQRFVKADIGVVDSQPQPFFALAKPGQRRGQKIKKKLAIDAVEAETVKLIYAIYLEGDGTTGPLGVKETTSWLNIHGYRTRRGSTFGVGPVHKILTNATYSSGLWLYGKRDSRNGGQHDPLSAIPIPVPIL